MKNKEIKKIIKELNFKFLDIEIILTYNFYDELRKYGVNIIRMYEIEYHKHILTLIRIDSINFKEDFNNNHLYEKK